MNEFTTTLVVFGCTFGGALLGIGCRALLPDDQRTSDTKEVVRIGMGLVGTMAALVLGLLITSAKGRYDTQDNEVTESASSIVLLDRILAHYGPEAKEVRVLLRSVVARQVDLGWLRIKSDAPHLGPRASRGEALFDRVQQLSPRDEDQRLLKTQALDFAIKLGQLRWLMFEQTTSSVPAPLLGMLTFWLVLLFLSFGLFARPNVTLVGSLFAAALATSGAVFLILEMYEPYAGLIQVSTAPLREALAQLGR